MSDSVLYCSAPRGTGKACACYRTEAQQGGMIMATDYPTDPFTILRIAMYGIVADRYETETARGNPDPHYLQHLKEAGDAIFAAQSFADLASVQWVQGQSALGMDYL